MPKRRWQLIRRKAELLDQLISTYREQRMLKNFPRQKAASLVAILFPTSKPSGNGWYKAAFKLQTKSRDVILKVSDSKNIEADRTAYRRLPKNIRNRYFAKIYWTTQYCLLQKFGRRTNVPDDEKQRLRRIARTYGLCDINDDNIRCVDGRFKIIDATPSSTKVPLH